MKYSIVIKGTSRLVKSSTKIYTKFFLIEKKNMKQITCFITEGSDGAIAGTSLIDSE